MKILDVFGVKDVAQRARDLFYRTWHVCTRTVVRTGPRSVSWVVFADLDGSGKIPTQRVAAGVCSTRAQADAAMARWFRLWTIAGPAGMVGRAGW